MTASSEETCWESIHLVVLLVEQTVASRLEEAFIFPAEKHHLVIRQKCDSLFQSNFQNSYLQSNSITT